MKSNWQILRTATPGEFESLLHLLGLSQSACGRYLGVSGRTVRRYVAGERHIPEASVLLLRALVAHRVVPRVPKWRKGES
jgi:DNA-binding transcriptional regulator YiaG